MATSFRSALVASAVFALVHGVAAAAELPVVGTGDGMELLRALGAAYTADNPKTQVVVPPSIGSGGGIAAVGSEKEVLARIARPLSIPSAPPDWSRPPCSGCHQRSSYILRRKSRR